MTIRQAIITFDQKRVGQWDMQAEGQVIAYLFKAALTGREHAKERGVISIDLLGHDQSVFIGPAEGIDGQMTVSAQ